MKNIAGLTKCLLIVIVFYTEVSLAQEVIRHPQFFKDKSPQTLYFVHVLDLACKASEKKFGTCRIEPVELPMLQERQLKSVNKGLLDIMWTATTDEREQTALAIKFPLLAGLLGYRVAVFNQSVKTEFEFNSTLNQIKKLKLVQGHDWPDTVILKRHGFNVLETTWYDFLYRDTSKGVYDYTLRGVFEVLPEFQKYKQPNLQLDNNHLIVYPFNIYFFVAKNNTKLAQRIEFGLNELNKDNQYLDVLLRYPSHQHSIQKLNLTERKIHLIGAPKDQLQNVKNVLAAIERHAN